VDDESRPWAGQSGLVIGIPAGVSPDEFEQSALAQIGDRDSFAANVARGLARHARHQGYADMRRILPFFSNTVAPALAVLGAVEDESQVSTRIYDEVEAAISGQGQS
jgi:hypothetical protein